MTTTAIKQPIQAYSNDHIKTIHFSPWVNMLGDDGSTDDLFTLRGRIEFLKDLRAINRAASLSGAVVNTGGLDEVKVSFFMNETTQERVDKFIIEVIRALGDEIEDFRGMGIEPHVYLESLKPIELYDGERDGPLDLGRSYWKELL